MDVWPWLPFLAAGYPYGPILTVPVAIYGAATAWPSMWVAIVAAADFGMLMVALLTKRAGEGDVLNWGAVIAVRRRITSWPVVRGALSILVLAQRCVTSAAHRQY